MIEQGKAGTQKRGRRRSPAHEAKMRQAIKLRESGLSYSQVAKAAGYISASGMYKSIRNYLADTGTGTMQDLLGYRDS